MLNSDYKLKELKKNLRKYDRVVIAFSGGKDSFFLLKIAIESLGEKNVFPLFVKTNFTSKNDEIRIEYFKKFLGFNLKIINVNVLTNTKIASNPQNRCYLCKRTIFKSLLKTAKILGTCRILDGTSFSDLSEFRPGLRALEELHIISPLKENQITSAEVVQFLRSWGVEDYYLTSSTCLATRFPYGFKLDQQLIEKFDKLETFLVKNNLYPVRARHIQDGIRIEIEESKFPELLRKKAEVIKYCKNLEFKFITFDLEGLKTGVWD